MQHQNKNTVDRLLLIPVNDSSKSNTTVSVVRLASPTPSIEEELNEQEELEKEMALHASDEESAEDGEKEDIPKIPNVSVVVEKYYNADEAKQLASEILSMLLSFIVTIVPISI